MQKRFFPLFVLLFFSVVFATESKVKEFKSFADFKEGTFSSIALADNGVLTLAPATQKIFDAKAQHIWQLAATGETIYLASGSPAHILRLAGEKADTVFSSQKPAVFAMATAKNKTLYFAPSPGGKLYRLQNGQIKLFAELKVRYIWDILPEKNGLLLATGDPGLILHLDTQAKIDTFFTSTENHIRVITRDTKGNLYAGSADHGLVFRFNKNGDPFVLYDSPETEIFNIITAENGEIWAAGLSEKLSRSAIPAMKNAIKKSGNGSSEHKSRNDLSAKPAKNGGSSKGALYKISTNGVARNFWSGAPARLQSMLRQKDGSILAGSGDSGQVFRLHPDGDIEQLLDFDAEQIVAIKPQRDGALLATANSGMLYKVLRKNATNGFYESTPFDAGSFTNWGSLSWRGTGQVKFSVRSGNTGTPDETWSTWQHLPPSTRPQAIKSPTARFFQWRADFIGEAKLSAVSFGYKQQNIAPILENIIIHEPGIAFPDAVKDGSDGDGQTSAVSARKKVNKTGFQSISWNMRDENGDPLSCTIAYKMQDTGNWRTMIDDYTAAVYSWDTRTLEDGIYHIKISVSDKKNNTNNSFSTTKISEDVLVDNSVPEITAFAVRDKKIVFQAGDKFSRIVAAYFAIDSGDWQALAPADGIADSRSEKYEIDASALKKGAHTVMVKIADERNNTAYRHLNIKF